MSWLHQAGPVGQGCVMELLASFAMELQHDIHLTFISRRAQSIFTSCSAAMCCSYPKLSCEVMWLLLPAGPASGKNSAGCGTC